MDVDSDNIIGYIKLEDSNDLIGIINKKGHITQKKHHNMVHLKPMYEPYTNSMENFSNYEKRIKMALKKLKPNKNLPHSHDYVNDDRLIGQIVDSTEQYTKGLILKESEDLNKLILVQKTPIIKHIPVYAVLMTK
jgi:hypothetical protein